jgi:hypothetical protein
MKNKRTYKRGTTMLKVTIDDSVGWIYKDKRPIVEALPPLIDFITEGLQLDIVVNKKKKKR